MIVLLGGQNLDVLYHIVWLLRVSNLIRNGYMEKLPRNFEINSLGLMVRLVEEKDTDYILSLRTNKFLARFIHQTDDDKDAQIEWIKRYKKREAAGREYYFIYFLGSKPVGLNRIYNIFEYYGTIGSWICNPDNEAETSLKTYILMFDLMFDHIKLDITLFDVRKVNKHVWKLHKMLGAIQVGESDIDYYFTLNKETYYKNRENIISLFNLNV